MKGAVSFIKVLDCHRTNPIEQELFRVTSLLLLAITSVMQNHNKAGVLNVYSKLISLRRITQNSAEDLSPS
jgi:hypothetical protein